MTIARRVAFFGFRLAASAGVTIVAASKAKSRQTIAMANCLVNAVMAVALCLTGAAVGVETPAVGAANPAPPERARLLSLAKLRDVHLDRKASIRRPEPLDRSSAKGRAKKTGDGESRFVDDTREELGDQMQEVDDQKEAVEDWAEDSKEEVQDQSEEVDEQKEWAEDQLP